MLILRKAGDHFFIDHFIESSAKHLTYRFSRDQLPQRTIAHLDSLTADETAEGIRFALNKEQDSAIMDILDKIIHEETSQYIYADQLIQTYLIELIHLITKIQQAASFSIV